jgi:hypothetical protein
MHDEMILAIDAMVAVVGMSIIMLQICIIHSAIIKPITPHSHTALNPHHLHTVRSHKTQRYTRDDTLNMGISKIHALKLNYFDIESKKSKKKFERSPTKNRSPIILVTWVSSTAKIKTVDSSDRLLLMLQMSKNRQLFVYKHRHRLRV